MELGYAAKTLGPKKKGLPAEDARRHKNNPNLGRSLELAHGVIDWLELTGIKFWRLPSHMAPYGTHPQFIQFHGQGIKYNQELYLFGKRLKDLGIRVSKHPGQYTVLGSPKMDVNDRSLSDVELQSELLDRMEMDDAVIVLHIGGRYDDPQAAQKRFLSNLDRLSASARKRLVLENDDRLWSATEVYKICQISGQRMVFDIHHHHCHNPEEQPSIKALMMALSTWPDDSQPKVHLSTGRDGGRPHANHISDDDWIEIHNLHQQSGRDFDIMLEAKDKDYAVLDLAQRIQNGQLPRPLSLSNLPAIPAPIT